LKKYTSKVVPVWWDLQHSYIIPSLTQSLGVAIIAYKHSTVGGDMTGAVDVLATLMCYTVTATDRGIHRLWERRILLTRFVQ